MRFQLFCWHVRTLRVKGECVPILGAWFFVPPLDGQRQITEHINASCAKIDTAIAHTQRRIELIQGYQTNLTTQGIAGQVDVRSATRVGS